MQTSRPHTEQTEDRQPTRAGGATRPTTPGGAALAPPLTADVLRAAQRGAGNAAVARMIARRARTAPGPQQPGTGVREVLGSAGRPLAMPVRQEMESRFGTDFSDVRLHTGAAAARSARAIGARAYTSGSHVVVGEGGGDRHTLAHELTHVVQQRQGPVPGTDHGDGLAVSDPSDTCERAAEQNARRVLSGPRPTEAGSAATGSGPTAGPGTGPGTDHVQRKVGFEFEVIAGDSWQIHEIDEAGGKSLKTDTKAALIDLPGDLAYVSADNGNVEFVTHPLETLADVRKALDAIVTFHEQLSAERTHTEGQYRITAVGKGRAKAQATFGIRMQDLGELADTLTALSEQANQPQSTSGRALRSAGASGGPEAGFSNRVTEGLSNLGLARTAAEEIVEGVAGQSTAAALEETVAKEVGGLLTVILKTLEDASGRRRESVDPKYFFPLMPRTDFVSMRRSLSADASGWITAHLGALYAAIDPYFHMDTPVFPGKYKLKPAGPALTRRTWLDSVFVGNPQNAKDLLSPPPGYPRHDEPGTVPEGIGAMGTDEDLSLFELRDLGKEPLEAQEWPGLAVFIAKTIGAATGDDRLRGQ